MKVYAIDHIQLAMPTGQEEKARSFYGGVLGLSEQPKPPHLAKRGGIWFEDGGLKIHLGVDKDFRPASKAHPALLVKGIDALAEKCRSAGYEVTLDEPLEGYERVYVSDPFREQDRANGAGVNRVALPRVTAREKENFFPRANCRRKVRCFYEAASR